jgi:monoamine oxidase
MSTLPSRRRFLTLLAAAGVTPVLTSRCAAATEREGAPRVIVIGAGIAGLAAAATLEKAGVATRVLEARDRRGGRIWTSRAIGGIPLDLGASWIHGDKGPDGEGSPIYELAKKNGIATIPFDYDDVALYGAGRRLYSDSDAAAYEAAIEGLAERIAALAESRRDARQPDIPLSRAIEQLLEELEPSARVERELLNAVNHTIEHEFANAAEKLSLFSFDSADAPEGVDRLFPGGYDQIIDVIARDVPDLRLKSPVKRIEAKGDEVLVQTASGTESAEHVLCTLPIGVLKAGKVTFDPPLAGDHARAIKLLSVGALDKLYVRYDEPFWNDEETAVIDWVGDPPGRWSEHVNVLKVFGKPLLLSFNAGAYAAELARKDDATVLAEATAAYRAMFGNEAVPDRPSAYLRTNWANDPWALGSYSSFGVGSSRETIEAFAEAHAGRVHFAGEHTSPAHPATVHGAYQSGVDAAKRILAELE